MRVVTNDALISRNQTIARMLFFASFGVLIASFFIINSISNPDSALAIQIVIIPLMFVLVIWSVRMTNLWLRPPVPWEALKQGLKGVGSDAALYNYVLPAEHVLFTSSGIYAIKTCFQDRPQKVVGDEWQSSGGLFAFMRQEQIGNPSQDAIKRAKRVEEYLQKLLVDESISVKPLVVFVHPKAQLIMEEVQTVPVLYSDPDRKEGNTLKSYIKEAKQSGNGRGLTSEQHIRMDDELLYEKEKK